METIPERKKSGLHSGAIRTWAMLFVAAGVISRGILQRTMLGMGSISGIELLEIMNSSENSTFTLSSMRPAPAHNTGCLVVGARRRKVV